MKQTGLQEPAFPIFQIEPEIFHATRNRVQDLRRARQQAHFTHNRHVGGKDLLLSQFRPGGDKGIASGNLVKFQTEVIRTDRILGRLPAPDSHIDVKVEQKPVRLQNGVKIGQSTGIPSQPLVILPKRPRARIKALPHFIDGMGTGASGIEHKEAVSLDFLLYQDFCIIGQKQVKNPVKFTLKVHARNKRRCVRAVILTYQRAQSPQYNYISQFNKIWNIEIASRPDIERKKRLRPAWVSSYPRETEAQSIFGAYGAKKPLFLSPCTLGVQKFLRNNSLAFLTISNYGLARLRPYHPSIESHLAESTSKAWITRGAASPIYGMALIVL